jgi:hypothetical protein
MNEGQKQAEINAYKNLLEQNDYIARKVAFEVAAKLKELYPDLSMPVFEHYLELEAKAESFRNRINELEQG